MAEMTIKKIAEYLDKFRWHYQLDRENERIITGFSGKNGNYLFGIHLQRSNNTLVMQTVNLAKASEGPNLSMSQLSKLLEALLNMSYRTALGGFERDVRDGEIAFCIGMPTEDGGPTRDQFVHVLMAACATVDRFYPEIQEAIYGGKKKPTGPKVKI